MKKLIYFTLGYNKNYIKIAELCIKSLYQNNYDGDFLFITNLKEDIINSINFQTEPYFVNLGEADLLNSSSNKLKIYRFDKIYEYDKIIYCDLDILWLSNPDIIFNEIIDNKFYVSNEESLMSHEFWGSNLINNDEKDFIIKNDIKGINAGIFGFNTSMISHLQKIELFLLENQTSVNSCLEQPFLNVYLFRNNLYDNILNKYVSHNGYNIDSFDGVALHFAGGPGNFAMKYTKMSQFNYNLKPIIFETRNDLLQIVNKNFKICEIGVFKGEFSKTLFNICSPKELHLIDIFEGDMCSGDKDGNNVVWTNLNEEFTKIKLFFENDNNVYIHKGFSYDVMNTFDDEYFDMVYIDGDHTYEGVKKDLTISLNKVKKGGLICGHDYISSKFEGVVRAVDEFCSEHNLKINYLTKDGCPTFCIIKNN
jgi:hypothetical protein